jgi:hypothetical protein
MTTPARAAGGRTTAKGDRRKAADALPPNESIATGRAATEDGELWIGNTVEERSGNGSEIFGGSREGPGKISG